jgi:nitrous oxide reductase accessory protein NosL
VASREAHLRKVAAVALAGLLMNGCSVFRSLPPAPGPSQLDESAIRQFEANQETAWNTRDFDHFYAHCAPDAVFVSIHWNADGSITREQRTLLEDRAAAERFFAAHPGKLSEIDAIDSIQLAPDRRSARILGRGTVRFLTNGRGETLNASTDQTVVLRDGHILSLGQIRTFVR